MFYKIVGTFQWKLPCLASKNNLMPGLTHEKLVALRKRARARFVNQI